MNIQPADPQSEWARNLVLLAKNTYIWLDQLSHKYHKHIKRLDQIPAAEIAEIASRGITGLWLVGIWQRSPASRKIKQLCGRRDALASAYSISEYQPADALGGEKALFRLKEKMAAHGMLLASDMVPNHSGMDASWMFSHPERYVYTASNPNPNFHFNTPNLSNNPDGEIYIEKGYYDQSGAAEVFKFVSHLDGKTRFVYHGNDGTSMPWNDTAQLNYLNPETRRAVIEEIVKVARKFPIIRLDAAMTLTRKHFQRLWFPLSPNEESIPTRDGFCISAEEFDRLMPREFWAEAIAELSAQTPQTLLIAEAFWLTEHFFINEIGMHRVYNSAFMHQLRDENNREYRAYIRHILATQPIMLERFVNFLTTPDESPAVVQFGNSAKYLGACRLLACLPGLPMFGHGQWEGSQERYGMDIPRPTLREETDNVLMAEHERWIKPLLLQRSCFSTTENFRMYDFVQADESINENVLVFSNASKGKAFVIVFNNSPLPAQGIITHSVPQKIAGTDQTVSRPLCKNLNLKTSGQCVLVETSADGQTARQASVEISSGLSLNLSPYESRVYQVRPV